MRTRFGILLFVVWIAAGCGRIDDLVSTAQYGAALNQSLYAQLDTTKPLLTQITQTTVNASSALSGCTVTQSTDKSTVYVDCSAQTPTGCGDKVTPFSDDTLPGQLKGIITNYAVGNGKNGIQIIWNFVGDLVKLVSGVKTWLQGFMTFTVICDTSGNCQQSLPSGNSQNPSWGGFSGGKFQINQEDAPDPSTDNTNLVIGKLSDSCS